MNPSSSALGTVRVRVAHLEFLARLEKDVAPRTCAAFERLLPFRTRLVQARWSGEAAWVPLGDLQLGVGSENGTDRPQEGQVLFYAGGLSECEILFPYGLTSFACRAGPLFGNHFLTIIEGIHQLPTLGELVLWHGAQDILFEHAHQEITSSTVPPCVRDRSTK